MPDLKKPSLAHKLEHCLQVSLDQTDLDKEFFNTWECNFLNSIEKSLGAYGSLSEKQAAILDKLYARIEHLPYSADEDDETFDDDRPF